MSTGSIKGVIPKEGCDTIDFEEEYVELTTAGSGVFPVPEGTLFIRGFMVGGGQGGMDADHNYAAGGLGGESTEFSLPVSGVKEIPYYIGKGGVNGEFTAVTRFGENTWFNTEDNFALGGRTPNTSKNYPPLSSWRGSVLNYQLNSVFYNTQEREAGLLDGVRNPLNPDDENLYGAVGGSGFNPEEQLPGGTTGSGSGGKRGLVGQTTPGTDATFYGAGGGGGGKRDSSTGAGSPGGKGYQGIIILKLYKQK